MSTLSESGASPMSDIPSEDGMTTLTMREKALIKRHISKQHNSNFRAGYVPVHEQYLHKTGLRGRKTYIFWTLIVILFLLALGNLFLTFTILGVLRLGQGMESLEFVPSKNLTKFFGNTDLGEVYKRDGKIGGFADDSVEITSEDGPVFLQVLGGQDPLIQLDPQTTHIKNVDSFSVIDPKTGEAIFSTNYPNFGLPKKVQKLDIQIAKTRRITSPINYTLYLESDLYARLRGNEGTHLEGGEIIWSADQDVYLKSVNGSIILSSSNGISLDVHSLPLAGKTDRPETSQYKICVCMPKGRLFKIPVPADNAASKVGCHSVKITSDNNPCM